MLGFAPIWGALRTIELQTEGFPIPPHYRTPRGELPPLVVWLAATRNCFGQRNRSPVLRIMSRRLLNLEHSGLRQGALLVAEARPCSQSNSQKSVHSRHSVQSTSNA
jgi:hypothetical protein